jgi:hypothetical protein
MTSHQHKTKQPEQENINFVWLGASVDIPPINIRQSNQNKKTLILFG